MNDRENIKAVFDSMVGLIRYECESDIEPIINGLIDCGLPDEIAKTIVVTCFERALKDIRALFDLAVDTFPDDENIQFTMVSLANQMYANYGKMMSNSLDEGMQILIDDGMIWLHKAMITGRKRGD